MICKARNEANEVCGTEIGPDRACCPGCGKSTGGALRSTPGDRTAYQCRRCGAQSDFGARLARWLVCRTCWADWRAVKDDLFERAVESWLSSGVEGTDDLA